jgi:protein arginine kinase activator
MQCELCHQHEAVIHLTQVINGDVRKLHLCDACARESGVDVNNPSLTELLLGFGNAATRTDAKRARVCPVCHLRESDFKKSGRLGCPSCYDAFEEELAPMIRSMHRQPRHIGKIPRGRARAGEAPTSGPSPSPPMLLPKPPPPPKSTPPPPPPMGPEEVIRMQRALDAAVEREDYEEAARLRDEMRARLSKKPEAGA